MRIRCGEGLCAAAQLATLSEEAAHSSQEHASACHGSPHRCNPHDMARALGDLHGDADMLRYAQRDWTGKG
ncbi:hypothetical protein [Chiayiivirga flava]|uniref:Uncharacterized protein n=1 Tax=Chiayiivirga flava TaxID=659595 RepID=A0A7W8D6Z4_9GAMM|nr:hypothetical protein [Chiayiivirga flava]MBB5209068.1 hypothetical protein [Chiayiivirga flava]